MNPESHEEVKPMDEERNVLDLRSMSVKTHCGDPGMGRDLAGAGAALRLAGGEDEDLQHEQASARTRRSAENFRKWKESKAPINEILVKLSDRREIEVRKTFATDLCGFFFVRKFSPGEALYVYKKADKYFDEVELLSVCVDEIGPEGYVYKKQYPNGQTFCFKAQICPDGEFYVSVDYTLAKDLALGASTFHSVIPFIGPILLGFSTWWNRTTRGSVWHPSRAFAFTLLSLTLLLGGLYAGKGGANATSQVIPPGEAGAATAMVPGVERPAVETTRPENEAGRGIEGATSAQDANEAALRREIRTIRNELVKIREAQGSNINVTQKIKEDINSRQKDEVGATCNVKVDPLQTRADSNRQRTKTTLASSRATSKKQPVSPSKGERIAIYVKAYVEGNSTLTQTIEGAFVSALKKMNRFTVLTEADEPNIPTNAYWVNLRFTQKEGCKGTIIADLYVKPNAPSVWGDERDCHDYPDGNIVKQASQELAASMAAELDTRKGGGLKSKDGD